MVESLRRSSRVVTHFFDRIIHADFEQDFEQHTTRTISFTSPRSHTTVGHRASAQHTDTHKNSTSRRPADYCSPHLGLRVRRREWLAWVVPPRAHSPVLRARGEQAEARVPHGVIHDVRVPAQPMEE